MTEHVVEQEEGIMTRTAFKDSEAAEAAAAIRREITEAQAHNAGRRSRGAASALPLAA